MGLHTCTLHTCARMSMPKHTMQKRTHASTHMVKCTQICTGSSRENWKPCFYFNACQKFFFLKHRDLMLWCPAFKYPKCHCILTNQKAFTNKYTNVSLNGQFMRPWDYTWRDLDSFCHKQMIPCFIHAHTLRQRTELFTPAHAYACIYSCIRMSVFPNDVLNVHAYAYQHTSILERSAIKSVYIMDVIVIWPQCGG